MTPVVFRVFSHLVKPRQNLSAPSHSMLSHKVPQSNKPSPDIFLAYNAFIIQFKTHLVLDIVSLLPFICPITHVPLLIPLAWVIVRAAVVILRVPLHYSSWTCHFVLADTFTADSDRLSRKTSLTNFLELNLLCCNHFILKPITNQHARIAFDSSACTLIFKSKRAICVLANTCHKVDTLFLAKFLLGNLVFVLCKILSWQHLSISRNDQRKVMHRQKQTYSPYCVSYYQCFSEIIRFRDNQSTYKLIRRSWIGKNRHTHHTAFHITSVFLKKSVLESNNQHISSLDACRAHK